MSNENNSQPQPFAAAQRIAEEASNFVPLANGEVPTAETLCDFPADWAPAPLRDFAAAVSASTQTPLCLCVTSVLAAATIAVQGKFRVRSAPDYAEPLNLFFALVAASGERKSAVIRSTVHFLQEYEAEKNKRPENRRICLLCDDLEPDKLVAFMAENDGRAGLVSTTGGVFGSIRRYRDSGTAIFNAYAKCYSGSSVSSETRGGGEKFVLAPSLTMLLELQPVLIKGFLGNRNPRCRDFASHVLYAAVNVSNSPVGHRAALGSTIPAHAKNAYESALRHMLDYQPAETQTLCLSDAAEAVRADFFEWLEPQLTGPLSGLNDWAAKLPGAVCRIAGILHCYEVDRPSEQPIAGLTMERAVALGHCFLQHARVLYGAAGGDPAIENANFVLEKLAGLEKITKRDLFRACRSRFKTVGEMEPTLKLLREHGYLREVITQPKGGHRPSVIFYVNL